MFTPDSINALQKTELYLAAQAHLNEVRGMYAVPPGFGVQDFEKHLPAKRRDANTYTTNNLQAWACYINQPVFFQEDAHHASTFINPKTLSALCVLNHYVGTDKKPGHCDNRAILSLEPSPEHIALQFITRGHQDQRPFIEWLEDNADCIKLARAPDGDEDEPQEIPLRHAIAALRTITIESAKKVETEVRNLGASRSAFDSVTAKAREGQHIPTMMSYTHTPYIGLDERVYHARIAILTGGPAPKFSITIRNEAQHMADMARELQAKIEAINDGIPCYVGEFSVGK